MGSRLVHLTSLFCVSTEDANLMSIRNFLARSEGRNISCHPDSRFKGRAYAVNEDLVTKLLAKGKVM